MNGISRDGYDPIPVGLANTYKRATISQIDLANNRCFAKDQVGKEYEIPLHRLKGTGVPAEGELWMIERVGQGWKLESQVDPATPTAITGSKSGVSSVTLQLLSVLHDLGIVDDQTT